MMGEGPSLVVSEEVKCVSNTVEMNGKTGFRVEVISKKLERKRYFSYFGIKFFDRFEDHSIQVPIFHEADHHQAGLRREVGARTIDQESSSYKRVESLEIYVLEKVVVPKEIVQTDTIKLWATILGSKAVTEGSLAWLRKEVETPITRQEFLKKATKGLGAFALAVLGLSASYGAYRLENLTDEEEALRGMTDTRALVSTMRAVVMMEMAYRSVDMVDNDKPIMAVSSSDEDGLEAAERMSKNLDVRQTQKYLLNEYLSVMRESAKLAGGVDNLFMGRVRGMDENGIGFDWGELVCADPGFIEELKLKLGESLVKPKVYPGQQDA